jgi:hypothetical protein
MRLVWLVLGTAAAAAAGCKCETTFGVCREAASSNVIFVGTVEAISPLFLDDWNESQKASLEKLNHASEQGAATLREAYRNVFPDLPPEHKRRFDRAQTSQQLGELFYWILDHGKRVRFTVREWHRNEEEDEKQKAPGLIDIWTAFGDCGVNFQLGETYLVYADSDEESDVITTSSCHRTRRLSEAGEDLAHLFFRKAQPKLSGRLEVFVTGSLEASKERDRDHYSERIGGAMAGAVVQVEGSGRKARGTVDEYGRAVFDGLAPGEHEVTVFAPGYPAEKKVLSGTRKVSLDERACGVDVVTLVAR